MQWPDPERAEPYRRTNLHRPARWRDDDPPLPVSSVPDGAHRARISVGDRDGQRFFWCRSCNRPTRSDRQAFCDKHAPLRARYMRKRRDATHYAVPRQAVDDLSGLSRRLDRLLDQGDDVGVDLLDDIAAAIHAITDGMLHVDVTGIDDTDYTIN